MKVRSLRRVILSNQASAKTDFVLLLVNGKRKRERDLSAKILRELFPDGSIAARFNSENVVGVGH